MTPEELRHLGDLCVREFDHTGALRWYLKYVKQEPSERANRRVVILLYQMGLHDLADLFMLFTRLEPDEIIVKYRDNWKRSMEEPIPYRERLDKLQLDEKETGVLNERSLGGERLAGMLSLMKKHRPTTVMEIGTFRGISAAAISGFLEDSERGTLTSIDINPQTHAMWLLRELGFSHRVRFICGDSRTILPALVNMNERFDLVLIDGNHSYDHAKSDYQHSKTLLKPGGIILYDNAGIPDLARLLEEIRQESQVSKLSKDLMTIIPS